MRAETRKQKTLAESMILENMKPYSMHTLAHTHTHIHTHRTHTHNHHSSLVLSQLFFRAHRALEPWRRLDKLFIDVRDARVAVSLVDSVDFVVECRGERFK